MQLPVHIGDTLLHALVDSRYTHSFISESTATRLLLILQLRPGLHITVANGDRVPVVGVCKVIHNSVDREEFVLDLSVIPLEGFKMVLGVHWL
jgi:hypothetical protein